MTDTPSSAPARNLTDFTGRRVLITAGAAGIGRAIAGRFRELGARVLVSDIDEGAVEAARRDGLTAVVSDSASEEQTAALMDAAGAELGGLDVLVNNAGIAGPTGPIETLDSEAWRRTFDVNIHSQFYAVKHGLALLRRSENASIVNLSSAAGRLGMAGRSPYSSSKWAVIGLTKTLAIELGAEGIRVNAICPGAVNGPRIDGVIEAKAQMLGRDVGEVARLYRAQSSLGRLIEPDDIADAAVFLASPLAASITGQALAVDGNTEKLY
ncbi:SDR family oxidoreductase [Sediminivirga luteola]|uniref:SDR family oxidoreductase n=1 Tax=Sediminivirga luteola TaxID=1774748 RepID=UPI001663B3C4|nr:SDR family oxidoreductase [Sediminivirga luteola]MCI2265910.1 SDR family oxidoreductase [Sediminivirga luteola]